MSKARVIALYLPQYHPTEINDKYWGKGFTEWRNVAKATPLYKGHYQPRIPADLGFYDLRLQEIQIEQAEMAREYGVEGFCYWHYWFGNGEMILEKPLERVVETGKPDYPFCVGWANHTWSNKTWEKTKAFQATTIFCEQKYPGKDDYIEHFNYLLPMFKDERYIKVDGKPLFMVFNPFEIPDNELFIETWRELAEQNGLKGIHFVARAETAAMNADKAMIQNGEDQKNRYDQCFKWGYDAIYAVSDLRIKIMDTHPFKLFWEKVLNKLHLHPMLEKHKYKDIIPYLFDEYDYQDNIYPMLIPHWDNTPRQGRRGYVYSEESPELFGKTIEMALDYVKDKPDDNKILFVHSWNEWGEGAYLEPDLKYGLKYLEEVKKHIM